MIAEVWFVAAIVIGLGHSPCGKLDNDKRIERNLSK